jgi:hypothetical protein
MRRKRSLILCGVMLAGLAASDLGADEVEMQNGDRYFGDVLSVSAGTVTLQNENLGKISVPRQKVASLTFGTNANHRSPAITLATIPAGTNSPANAVSATLAGHPADLSAALRSLGSATNFIGQIKDQLLAGNPAASQKYDQLLTDLLSGKLDLNDLRRQAQLSADQIRELKRELGPEAGDALDGYLQILNQFLQETPVNRRHTQPNRSRRQNREPAISHGRRVPWRRLFGGKRKGVGAR